MRFSLVIVIALCAVGIVSCKKKKDDVTPVVVPVVDTPTFMLSNIQDIAFGNNKTTEWEIPVEWKSGSQEKVTIYISGLPPGVTAAPDSISGMPSFTPVFTLTSTFAAPGKYPVSVMTSSATSGSKKYDVSLTITSSKDCAALFTGSYTESTTTTPDTTYSTFSATVSTINATSFRINGGNVSPFQNVKANINCDNGTFTIPQQMANFGYDSVRGTGRMLADKKIMIVQYSFYEKDYNEWENRVDTLK